MKVEKEEIKICDFCSGTGYRPSGEECPKCLSKGRILRKTTVEEYPLDEENLKRKAVYG